MIRGERDHAKDEVEAGIVTLEVDVIPDLQEALNWLTRPDYDLKENSDHEYRDADIEFLCGELAQARRELRALLAK